jgi:hypothetical protein
MDDRKWRKSSEKRYKQPPARRQLKIPSTGSYRADWLLMLLIVLVLLVITI